MVDEALLIVKRGLALESVFEGKYRTRITLIDGVHYSEMSPTDLLNEVCMLYGSTKKGRIDTAKRLLGFWKKTPFAIIPHEVGAVPLVSSKRDDCVWLLNQPFKVVEIAKGRSLITLRNGVKIEVPCSKHTVVKQEKKLYTLLSKLKRIRDLYNTD